MIEGVHLRHDSVEVESQRIAPRLEAIVERDHLVDPAAKLPFLGDLESPFGEARYPVVVGRHADLCGNRQTPRNELEAALGDEPAVLAAERPRGRVPWVRERGLAGLPHRLVEALERIVRKQHFAPHLEARRHRGAAEFEWDRANRAEIGGDVFADRAVAAREPAHQDPVLVEERGGGPIELRLGRVLDRAGGAEPLADPRVELAHLVGGKEGIDRQHRDRVPNLGKVPRHRLAADAMGGRVGGRELGMGRLELLQLLE
jgi:hypothetical protein